MCGMLFVMYGVIIAFSSVLANIEWSVIGLYEVPMVLFLFGFGMSMLLDSFYMCDMMLMLRTFVYRRDRRVQEVFCNVVLVCLQNYAISVVYSAWVFCNFSCFYKFDLIL